MTEHYGLTIDRPVKSISETDIAYIESDTNEALKNSDLNLPKDFFTSPSEMKVVLLTNRLLQRSFRAMAIGRPDFDEVQGAIKSSLVDEFGQDALTRPLYAPTLLDGKRPTSIQQQNNGGSYAILRIARCEDVVAEHEVIKETIQKFNPKKMIPHRLWPKPENMEVVLAQSNVRYASRMIKKLGKIIVEQPDSLPAVTKFEAIRFEPTFFS